MARVALLVVVLLAMAGCAQSPTPRTPSADERAQESAVSPTAGEGDRTMPANWTLHHYDQERPIGRASTANGLSPFSSGPVRRNCLILDEPMLILNGNATATWNAVDGFAAEVFLYVNGTFVADDSGQSEASIEFANIWVPVNRTSAINWDSTSGPLLRTEDVNGTIHIQMDYLAERPLVPEGPRDGADSCALAR